MSCMTRAHDRAINYLYTTSTNLDLSRYNGMRIIVTGEEGLAERWNEHAGADHSAHQSF